MEGPERMEEILFQIITKAGESRSMYVEAIRDIRKGNHRAAKRKIEDGRKILSGAHSIHFELIQKEAGGESVKVGLLLVHAEDLMMSAETLGIIAEEMLGEMPEEGEEG